MNQAASEAWHSGNRGDQIFSNSQIEPTLRGFKKYDSESLKVNYETTLRGADLSKAKVVHSTYNQIMNIPYEDLAEFDYIFIDECHVISTDMSYRSDVITALLNYLIEFVAKKQSGKTEPGNR
jgi:superfamily II DNA or RNA helicase